MAIGAENLVSDAEPRVTPLKEKGIAGRRSLFTTGGRSLPPVFDESARATAEFSVCPHRSWPNKRLEPTRWTGAVIATRLLRSTVLRISKGRDCARQRVAHH